MHLSLKSSLGRQILTGSYVKDNRVLDLTTPFSELTFTLEDKSGEGNDATLYTGRYISTDGSTDRGIVADCSAAGAGNYYLTGKVRPNAVTTAELTMDGSTDSGLTGLTADVWQTFTTATSAVTPSAVQVGYDGSTASAADWSDVKLIDSSDGSTVARWQLNESADGDLNGYPALDSVGGYHGTHTGCAGGTGETTILQTAGMDWNKLTWFDGVDDHVDFGSEILFGNGAFSVSFSLYYANSPSDLDMLNFSATAGKNAQLFTVLDATRLRIRSYTSPFTIYNITLSDNNRANELADWQISRTGNTVTVKKNGATVGSVTVTAADSFGFNRVNGDLIDASMWRGMLYNLSVSGGSAWNNSTWEDTVNSNNGTVNGSPSNYLIPESDSTPTNDALGNAIAEPRPTADTWNLFGDGEYGRVADADSLDVTNAATWEIWGNFYNLSASPTEAFFTKFELTAGRSWGIFHVASAGDGQIGLQLTANGTVSPANYRGDITVSNTLQHIVYVYNGTTVVAYINGASTAVTNGGGGAIPASLYVGTDDVLIGAWEPDAPAAFADSKIARPKIYSRALTAAEVLQNFNAQKSAFGL